MNVSRSEETRRARGIHGSPASSSQPGSQGVSKLFPRVLEIKASAIAPRRGGDHASHDGLLERPRSSFAGVRRRRKQVIVTLEGGIGSGSEGRGALRRAAPEPYKGKGVKYAEERIHRKAGKTAGAGAK